MKLFVGLGNPGKKYEKTRHNAGYLLLERIAGERDFKSDEKFKAQILLKKSKGESLIFAKPETFMNMSGEEHPLCIMPVGRVYSKSSK